MKEKTKKARREKRYLSYPRSMLIKLLIEKDEKLDLFSLIRKNQEDEMYGHNTSYVGMADELHQERFLRESYERLADSRLQENIELKNHLNHCITSRAVDREQDHVI